MEWNIEAGIYLCFVLIYCTISMKKINPISLVVLRWPPNIITPLHWLILLWWFLCVGYRNEMADSLWPFSTSTDEAGNYRSCQTPKRSGHLPKVNFQEETKIYHAVQEDLKKAQAGWQTGGGGGSGISRSSRHATEEELGGLPMGGGSGASVVGAGDVDGGADALREREENVIGKKSVEAE